MGVLREHVVGGVGVVLRVEGGDGFAHFGVGQQRDVEAREPRTQRRTPRGVGFDEERGDGRAHAVEGVVAIGHHDHAARLARCGPLFAADAEAPVHCQRDLDGVMRVILHGAQVQADPQAAARPADHAADAGDGALHGVGRGGCHCADSPYVQESGPRVAQDDPQAKPGLPFPGDRP